MNEVKVNPLELVTTDDLLIELKRRFTTLLFSGTTQWDKSQAFTQVAFQGDWFHVLGLSRATEFEILDSWREEKIHEEE
jgi:hypothetical protein